MKNRFITDSLGSFVPGLCTAALVNGNHEWWNGLSYSLKRNGLADVNRLVCFAETVALSRLCSNFTLSNICASFHFGTGWHLRTTVNLWTTTFTSISFWSLAVDFPLEPQFHVIHNSLTWNNIFVLSYSMQYVDPIQDNLPMPSEILITTRALFHAIHAMRPLHYPRPCPKHFRRHLTSPSQWCSRPP